MRAYHVLIVLAGLSAIAGLASAQNEPCPECDPDGPSANNSYHSVDAGLIDANESGTNTELLADTDMSYNHDAESEKGFWLWFTICLSAFVDAIEDAIGVHTDVDANVQVYSDSQGTDVDASTHGLQNVCAELEVDTACDQDFDDGPLGDTDGMTYEAIATAEATTGADVWVPAFLPETNDSDDNACIRVDLSTYC